MTYQEQPMPTINDEPCIQDQVIADIEQRKQLGIERYGTTLQPFNGRSSSRDAYEEALDLAQYMKQMTIEFKRVVEVFHKITEAVSLTAAQVEAFRILVELGEIQDERH